MLYHQEAASQAQVRGYIPKTGNEGKVEVEDILEPLNGGSGLVGEDLDEVGPGLVTGRLEGIIVELLNGVLDAVLNLCPGEGTVDAGSGLGRVTTEETLLVENDDVTTGEVDGVSSAQAGHCM